MFTIEVSDEYAACDGERTITRGTLREAAVEVEELTGLPYSLIRSDLSEDSGPFTYDGLKDGETVTVTRTPVEVGGMGFSDGLGAPALARGRS